MLQADSGGMDALRPGYVVNGDTARPGDQADPDTDCIAVDGKLLSGSKEGLSDAAQAEGLCDNPLR